MPKFIGQDIPGSLTLCEDNATEASTGMVRLTYRQACLLNPESVRRSLDTTDKGSRGTYGKRWYRWFAPREAIRNCPRSTLAMQMRVFDYDVRHIARLSK